MSSMLLVCIYWNFTGLACMHFVIIKPVFSILSDPLQCLPQSLTFRTESIVICKIYWYQVP